MKEKYWKWHRYFILLPHAINGNMMWFRVIWRRRKFGRPGWEFSLIENKNYRFIELDQ